MSDAVARRWRDATPGALDAALAVAIAAAAELEVLAAGDFPGSAAAVAIAIPAMTLPIAVRRRAPVGAFLVVYAAYCASASLGGHAEQSIGVAIALLVVIASTAAYASSDRVAVGCLAVGQCVAWSALVFEGSRSAGDYAFSVLLGAGAWLGGYALRSGRLVAERLQGRAVQLEARSVAEQAAAVTAERARIAREMHDVVAHTLGVIVVQAGAARQMVHDEPAHSERLLSSVETTSREALSEMRRLLGLVRADGDDDGLAPQPGLRQLDEVIARARGTGLDVTAVREGDARPLSAGVDLAAYRIVQECLTNAVRHGAGRVILTLRYGVGELGIVVRNKVAPGHGDGPPTVGHGLIGMRERVGFYGGTIDAGLDGDDFAVRACLPTDERR